jgi:transposase
VRWSFEANRIRGGRVWHQSCLERFSSDLRGETDTVALRSPGTTDQVRMAPGLAPINLAIASGTVVRTEDEVPFFKARETVDLYTTGPRAGTSSSGLGSQALPIKVATSKGQVEGIHTRQTILLPDDIWQTFGIMRVARMDLPRGSLAAKGRRVLASGRISVARPGGKWLIRSETGSARYIVAREDGTWICTCQSFSPPRGCKHTAACQLLEGEKPTEAQLVQPRRSYSQNWAAYDLGQELEIPLLQKLLSDLASTLTEPTRLPGGGGRPPVPLRDQCFAAIAKVWSGRSGRRAAGLWTEAVSKGYLEEEVGRMTVQRFLNRADVTPVLHNLLTLSALPLAGLESGGAVAPDSTGIQTTSFGAWREAKHGEHREHRWLKVHAMVGTKTHVIIRAVVGEENSGDAPQFAPLLKWTLEAGFEPGRVVADRGYLSKENYRTATDLGLEAFIPFKSNSVPRNRAVSSPSAWRKAFYLFQANREEFDRNYHRRSNVESVFSALKRKFGENIRSKTWVAQVNELLCKLIAYNLTVLVHEIFENGIAPSFKGSPFLSPE